MLDLISQISVQQTKENEFISQHLPRAMGNAGKIANGSTTVQMAYGGVTTGVAAMAAFHSVPDQFLLFSMMGSFLGPARTDRKLHCRVSATRNTKTFATRRVFVYQILDDASERSCAELLLDFHVREQGMFEYSAAPAPQYLGDPEDPSMTASTSEITDRLLREGKITQRLLKAWMSMFEMYNTYFEARKCLHSANGLNLIGLGKTAETSQTHLAIAEKSVGEWFRTTQPLRNNMEHVAALVFNMDAQLSFLPLELEGKGLTDAGACSTLDFALRLTIPDIDLNGWHLKERKTIVAHSGRTYSEARVWDQKGRIVAIMSQTSICRPPVAKKGGSSKL